MTSPLLDIARRHLADGWNPIPLPPGAKWPPPSGVTGWNGRATTDADLAGPWDWSGNLGLRLPPGVIGIDVDAYAGGTLDDLEAKHGPLPPTRWSTSRDDGSGIAFFRVPVGIAFATDPAAGIDIIQPHHRYAVVEPSIHPGTGQPYRWIDEAEPDETCVGPGPVEDLPELPWPWIEALRVEKQPGSDAATPEAAREFTAGHVGSVRPAALQGVLTSLEGVTAGGRHDALTTAACWAMREVAAGLYPASEAIAALEGWWVTVMDDERRRNGGEFGAVILWAIGQASSDPERIEQIRRDTAEPFSGLADATSTAPRPNVDPATGEIRATPATNLPESFWAERPSLAHIRQAAHSKLVSADATLIAVLARVVALAPPTLALPGIVGTRASLNLFTAIIDPSGGGKTAAAGVAADLVPIDRADIIDPILPSSGEGLIEAFFGVAREEQPDGKTTSVKRQVHTSGIALVDEGQALLAQGERMGSTIMQTLRSAWMGADLGQHNATEERKRWLRRHNYRLSMIVGFQLAFAATLIADGEGGTPQRFTFALATDPAINPAASWPGPLAVRPPVTILTGDDFGLHHEIAAEIRRHRHAVSSGRIVVDPLDSHALLRREKIAAALALLDQRTHIDLDDWRLAGDVDRMSCAVRTLAVERASAVTIEARRVATRVAVEQDAMRETAAIERTMRRVARVVAHAVRRNGPLTPAEAWRSLASRDRQQVDVDSVIATAIAAGWVVESDGVLKAGGNPL